MLAQEIIRAKRDGARLGPGEIAAFVAGLVDGSWSNEQAAALAMAIYFNGMVPAETTLLTQAMTASGERLQWPAGDLPGPVLDKHSTGGVGDKTSLALAPIVAACGGFVPMLSARGLGHTGGTLDKLQAIPGYRVDVEPAELRRVVHGVGCAIVGAGPHLAPADRRLYAIRDVTATVESLPLIVASILSKKLAAGIHGLVMDVKVGNGAFAASRADADRLAQALVDVATAAGLPTVACLSDMNQVLGRSCGNSLEVAETIELLRGDAVEPRLLRLTRQLAAEMLCLGGLAADEASALRRVDAVLRSGEALERFGRMVAALGGPSDLLERTASRLPHAAVQHAVQARRAGYLRAMDTRRIGLAVVELGGGRRRAEDPVDPGVGFAAIAGLGSRLAAGEVIAVVHARDNSAARRAADEFLSALAWDEKAPAASADVVLGRVGVAPAPRGG
ncbi:MAG: thymidine phosphorylase [Pseudomonadota bacterium]|nr:thymidine phosphorylase [Pseudomonadota bacterium]